MKNFKIIAGFVLMFAFGLAQGQAEKTKKLGSFQRNRVSFQKARYGSSNKKVGKACTIFEKKRTKAAKEPIIKLGIFRRKSSNKKVAEQG